MPGINSSGRANTADYHLGRGKIYFGTIDAATGKPKDWRFAGNAPEFSVSMETEDIEHKASTSGLKTVDLQAVISQKMTLNLTLDELNFDNIAAFVSGAAVQGVSGDNCAIAGFTKRLFISTASGGVKLGRWYDIVNGSGVRAYDILAGDLVVEREAGGSDVVLTLGVDYELDLKFGRIFFISPAGAGALVDSVSEVNLTLAAQAGAKIPQFVRGLTTTTVRVAIKFVEENPANGDAQTEHQFHQVQLKANGDLAMIGDEFTTMPFTGTAEKNTLGFPTSPYYTATTHADA